MRVSDIIKKIKKRRFRKPVWKHNRLPKSIEPGCRVSSKEASEWKVREPYAFEKLSPAPYNGFRQIGNKGVNFISNISTAWLVEQSHPDEKLQLPSPVQTAGWQVKEYSDSVKQFPQLPALQTHFFTPIDLNNETSEIDGVLQLLNRTDYHDNDNNGDSNSSFAGRTDDDWFEKNNDMGYVTVLNEKSDAKANSTTLDATLNDKGVGTPKLPAKTTSLNIDVVPSINHEEDDEEIIKTIILSSHEKYETLDDDSRKQLIKQIIDYIFYEEAPKKPQYEKMAIAICSVYRCEKKEIYYNGRSGKLYDAYNKRLRQLRSKGRLPKSTRALNKIKRMQQLDEIEITDIVQKSLDYLCQEQVTYDADDCLYHWSICLEYRQSLFKSDNRNLQLFWNECKALKRSWSYIMICEDFKDLYGVECSESLIHNWQSVFNEEKIDLIHDLVKDDYTKLKASQMPGSEEYKNIKLVNYINAILFPPLSKHKWRPSIIDAQNSVVVIAKSMEDVSTKTADRMKFCEQKLMPPHPIIFAMEPDNEEDDLNSFVVVFGGTQYYFKHIIEALDPTKMIKCFVCSFNFESPQKLCEHMKIIHKLSGKNKYQCTICQQELTEMWRYRRHLDICYIKVHSTDEEVVQGTADDGQSDLLNFESKVHKLALELVCKLAGNMCIPRNFVFELLNEFRDFFSKMISEGYSRYAKPYVANEQTNNVDYLFSIFEDPFKRVDTEYKLDDILKKADLISSPLTKVEFINIDGMWHESSEVSEDECETAETAKERVTVMPLEFQFKKFFELPNVFEQTQKFTEEVSKQYLGHFINGKIWKKKLESFNEDDIVIPFHLHTDDVQINNALGAHRKRGLETCTYYSFPTVPPEYNSRLENIFVAQIFSSDANKKVGNFCCFNTMIKKLNEFGRNGITLNIKGKEKKVYFVLGLNLGDNKGVNDMCGFARGHRANYFCRFCKMHRKKTHTAYQQNDKLMRTIRNYANDLQKNKFQKTGLTEESVINLFYLCHATDSIGVDTMHDILEGILHYHMCEIILSLISEGIFTLDQLNQLKFDLLYGEGDAINKSPPITLKRLNAKKLLMSASEMNTFARHFVFMVGDLVPKSNSTWQFYLKTMEFVELMDLTSYTEADLHHLNQIIWEMNRMYVTLFNETLKPKHHYITHYPTLIRLYGPLRLISSMRFEAKHRFVKNYTKNTISRVDISHSLGRKMQYNFASYLMKNTGLKDRVSMRSSKFINLEKTDVFNEIEKSDELKNVLSKNLKETQKVTVNGITFSTKLYITAKENSKLVLMKIMKIVYASNDISDIFFLCKQHKNIIYNDSYGCNEVDMSSSEKGLKLISAVSSLNNRQQPISIHLMGDNIFRFKTKAL